MPRILGAEKNTLRLTDNIGGGEIVLYYRTPTTAERVAYSNMMVKRIGKKIKMQATAARLKYGAKILLGFRAGDFANSEGTPLASDPGADGYLPEWKDLLCEEAADVIEALAMQVFDLSCGRADEETDEPDEADEDDETPDPEDIEKN